MRADTDSRDENKVNGEHVISNYLVTTLHNTFSISNRL